MRTALLLLISFFLLLHSTQARPEEDDAGKDDYHLYDLLEKATKLTGSPSLHSLFSLPDTAPIDQVSRQFRQLSRTMHPDKDPSKAEHHALLSAAHHVLKDERMRARLKWLLDEAPPWHRATVYTVRKMMRRNKQTDPNPSLLSVVLYLLIGAVLVQWLLVVILWLTECCRVKWSRQQIDKLGKKEVKRMERKLAEHGPSRAMANSPVQQLLSAREYPPCPRLSDFWPFTFLFYVIGKLKRE